MRARTPRILGVLGAALLSIALTGCGGSAQKPALGNDTVSSIVAVTQSGSFKGPLDSTPDPNGTTIYFTAGGSNGPGVFSVLAAGGAAAEVAVGQPFVAPNGIAIGTDGKQIYVADPQASGTGQILIVPVAGGKPTALDGTAGATPRGIDVVSEGGKDIVYFTGKDPQDGQPGVFKLAASGGAPAVVAKGAPLVEPDGVVVTKAGVVYVSDRVAAVGGFGKIFKVADAKVTSIVDRVRTGNPAGVALTLDEAVLLVSALQPDRESDQVLLVDLSSLQTGSVTKVVEQNQKAGGVHRARNQAVFSWADSTAGPMGGKVFVIK